MGKRPDKPSKALRSAIERTFEATAGQAAGTRDRAVDLLEEIAKRGREGIDKIDTSVRGRRKG